MSENLKLGISWEDRVNLVDLDSPGTGQVSSLLGVSWRLLRRLGLRRGYITANFNSGLRFCQMITLNTKRGELLQEFDT